MSHEAFTPPSSKQHLWLPKIDAELSKINAGQRLRSIVPLTMIAVCRNLVLEGALTDFAELQYYLLARDAPVLLIAEEFEPQVFPDNICADYQSHEPRKYLVNVKPAETVRKLLGELSISTEGHAMMLTKMTGVRLPKKK